MTLTSNPPLLVVHGPNKLRHAFIRIYLKVDYGSICDGLLVVLQADDAESNNFRAFKVLRLFRLSKMLRLARIKRILSKYEDLEFVRNYSSMFGLGFVIVFMAHILSCLVSSQAIRC